MPVTWVLSVPQESFRYSQEVHVVSWIAFIFFVASVAVIAVLFASRIVKSQRERRVASLRSGYQKILNKIVVNEKFSEPGAPNPAFEFYMAELRLIAGNSNFARQVLLTSILEVKKSLTGKSAMALEQTYYAMRLYRQSLRKLRSGRWERKALAIRELAEMRHVEGATHVARFLYSRNAVLKQESLMAMVRLEAKPLSFLNDYRGELSLWMRISISRHLQAIDVRRLPLFSDYFKHPSVSVRLFSMSMARRFKQTSSLPGIAEMVYSDDARIVGLAIACLGEMEAYEYRDLVVKVASHVWRFEKLSRRVLQCLASIGDPEKDVALVGRFLDHPNYNVRFEAVSALKKLGAKGEHFLNAFNAKDPDRIGGILRHFSEPLLT